MDSIRVLYVEDDRADQDRTHRHLTRHAPHIKLTVAGTVAASFSLLVVALLPFRIADVMVAFAPGAQDTMMVLALALNLDPVYVGAHHLVRFLVVSLALVVSARRFARFMRTRRPSAGTTSFAESRNRSCRASSAPRIMSRTRI